MKKNKIITAGIAGMAMVLCIGFDAAAAKPYTIKSKGNILLEQESGEGGVAFYENDIKYLADEINKLKSQF